MVTVDFLKEGLRVLTQAVMEAEVSSLIGAEWYERSEKRSNSRNGDRGRNGILVLVSGLVSLLWIERPCGTHLEWRGSPFCVSSGMPSPCLHT